MTAKADRVSFQDGKSVLPLTWAWLHVSVNILQTIDSCTSLGRIVELLDFISTKSGTH